MCTNHEAEAGEMGLELELSLINGEWGSIKRHVGKHEDNGLVHGLAAVGGRESAEAKETKRKKRGRIDWYFMHTDRQRLMRHV